jgi:hypothetical protein
VTTGLGERSEGGKPVEVRRCPATVTRSTVEAALWTGEPGTPPLLGSQDLREKGDRRHPFGCISVPFLCS